MDYNVIYNEDCLQTMSRLDDDSIDLIVTSPPYNKNLYATSCGMSRSWTAMRGRQIAYDVYSDDMGRDEYIAWQKQIISECLRILKPCGSLFYNHKDVIVDGVIIAPTYVYDFPIHQHIIWNRGSSLANDPHYFQPITEHIYWIAKNPKNVYFDKKNAIFRQNIWNICFETNNPHPAPFPEKLVGNCILSCSKECDIVYDPFMGSGTTAIVANRFNRRYIGSEISEKYCRMADKRLALENAQLSLF